MTELQKISHCQPWILWLECMCDHLLIRQRAASRALRKGDMTRSGRGEWAGMLEQDWSVGEARGGTEEVGRGEAGSRVSSLLARRRNNEPERTSSTWKGFGVHKALRTLITPSGPHDNERQTAHIPALRDH